ncbi:MAG: LLM class flavin-dependent oxidoreductase [Actinomycetota bacterium]
MITRFGTLYVGQVDHHQLGFDTPAVNDRWYDDDHLASPLHVAEELAVGMDALGYDTLWLAEHHFQREGYECIPNIPLLATHLAARTERLRFGCGFNIIPIWHPLRLAEDYAMADVLTRGRVRLGVGRGYHSRELASLGPAGLAGPDNGSDDGNRASESDDPDAARDRFEEQVEVLLTALRQPSFRHRGRHYQLPPDGVEYRGYELEELTLVPKPRHSTECWQPIVSASDRGLDFMLDHDIKGFVGGGAASGGASETVARRWQAKLAERGRDTELGTDLIFGFSFYLADTEAEAKAAGRPILEEYQKMFGPLGFAGQLTNDQLDRLADPARAATAGLPTIDDAIAAGSWLVGPPEVLIEALTTVQETYPGLEEVMVAQPVGARPETIGEQLERFAGEVMPAFAPSTEPATAEPAAPAQAAGA